MGDKYTEFMTLALEEAKKAGQKDEVPIGAVLVAQSGDILSLAYNQTISQADPTAHAEILALREGAKNFKKGVNGGKYYNHQNSMGRRR